MSARLVKDIHPQGDSSPDSMLSLGGLLYFAADSGAPVNPPAPDPDNNNDNTQDQNDDEDVDDEEGSENEIDDEDQSAASSVLVGLH